MDFEEMGHFLAAVGCMGPLVVWTVTHKGLHVADYFSGSPVCFVYCHTGLDLICYRTGPHRPADRKDSLGEAGFVGPGKIVPQDLVGRLGNCYQGIYRDLLGH